MKTKCRQVELENEWSKIADIFSCPYLHTTVCIKFLQVKKMSTKLCTNYDTAYVKIVCTSWRYVFFNITKKYNQITHLFNELLIISYDFSKP